MSDELTQKALDYHRYPVPGKLSVEITKPTKTQEDLTLAYSPGVGMPVLEIAKDKSFASYYTIKDNLVGILTNGTAVLGFGNLGALASKPVMEGKAVLFKRFANIDCFDIEVNETDIDRFVQIVTAIAPTFGGINLEDIAAPACFEIERRLIEVLDIPVFHDDQHGTAIVTCAAIINALEIQNKKLSEVQLVCIGAGSAGIAVLNLLIDCGCNPDNIRLVDSRGVVQTERTDLNKYKQAFAVKTSSRTLADAIVGADVFVGAAKADILLPEMLKKMAPNPLVLALSNPNPEISPDLAFKTRTDIIMATGRSDYPNQVNNVLVFPYIFRGALDAKSKIINTEMKLACVNALIAITKLPVPQSVLDAYGLKKLSFGREYILPKPNDERLMEIIPKAVLQAAIDTKVSRL